MNSALEGEQTEPWITDVGGKSHAAHGHGCDVVEAPSVCEGVPAHQPSCFL